MVVVEREGKVKEAKVKPELDLPRQLQHGERVKGKRIYHSAH